MVKFNTKETNAMNTTNRYPPAGLPAEVHTPRPPTPLCSPTGKTPPPKDNPFRGACRCRRRDRLKKSLICLAVVAGLGAVTLPLWRSAGNQDEGLSSLDGIGSILGEGLLQGGLPPVGGGLVGTTAETTAEDPGETRPGTEMGTEGESASTWDPPEDTVPLDETQTQSAEADTAETEPGDTAAETSSPLSSDTSSDGETRPDTPEESTAANEPPTDAETDAAEPAETDAETNAVPDGCIPFAVEDMSLSAYGAGYVVGDTANLPAELPDGRLWSTAGLPTVLVVHTHPYEGYSEGGDWYRPDGGGLAQTDTPNATDGVVALGSELTRALRGAGITVIHLRVAASAEDTAAEIYARTQAAVRHYCRLYPDIGLVLNLRRSAELTEDGSVLRTLGTYDGEACAQLRISVSGSGEGLGKDLAAALSLRGSLWEREPTLSRPVRVKTGENFVSDGAASTTPRVLALELGSAGNTYAEALRLVAPLAESLADMLNSNG